MLARTPKTASTRLTQLSAQSSYQSSRKANTEATRHTKHKLNTGAEIPAVGFGTWRDENTQKAVTKALRVGYRHIDTARVDGTECAVGEAIKTSGIPRSEIFITSKLWNNSHHPDDVKPALKATLKRLKTKYLDLYTMRWPSPFARSDALRPMRTDKIEPGDTDYIDTWKAMEKLRAIHRHRQLQQSGARAPLERNQSRPRRAPTRMPPLAPTALLHRLQQEQGDPRATVLALWQPTPHLQRRVEDGQTDRRPHTRRDWEKITGRAACRSRWRGGIANGHSVLPKSLTPEADPK